MSANVAVASLFRQITERIRKGHFLRKPLNYWSGQRKCIEVSAKGPVFIYYFPVGKSESVLRFFFKFCQILTLYSTL